MAPITVDRLHDNEISAIQGEIAQLNTNRMRIVSGLITIGLISLFLINSFFSFRPNTHLPAYSTYSVLYALAYLINSTAFFSTTKYFRNTLTMRFIRNNKENCLVFYFWSMLIITSLITFYDQIYYNHIYIYITFLALSTSAIMIPMNKLAAPVIVTTIIANSSWLFIEETSQKDMINLIWLIVMSFILILLNHLNYRIIFKNLIQQKMLLKERQLSKELNSNLQAAAFTDELTTLSNRRGYLNRVQQYESKLPMRITVIILDIDFFKNYNDYYGHIYGDVALTKVAASLRKICEQPNRFAVRWGGEEFLILLENHNDAEIFAFYDSFIQNIHSFKIEHPTSETADYLTFSGGGYSKMLHSIDDIDECILKADEAQYEIKRTTKNDFLLVDDYGNEITREHIDQNLIIT